MKTKQGQSGNNTPDGGGDHKTLVNVEYASCSLMMDVPTKEWDDLLSPVNMFCQNSSQEVLKMEPIKY